MFKAKKKVVAKVEEPVAIVAYTGRAEYACNPLAVPKPTPQLQSIEDISKAIQTLQDAMETGQIPKGALVISTISAAALLYAKDNVRTRYSIYQDLAVDEVVARYTTILDHNLAKSPNTIKEEQRKAKEEALAKQRAALDAAVANVEKLARELGESVKGDSK